MRKLIASILFTIVASCGSNCEEIPTNFSNYSQATNVVLRSDFKLSEEANVSNSSWITSANYFSCDGLSGFFVIKMRNRTYIHQGMPYEVWANFKNADSKGHFYSRNIRGRYRLNLN